MAYHTITAPVDDAIAFEKAAIDKTLVLPDVEGTLIAPQFSHIFSGGYAAGYYGYKWAEVLDADAFSVFKANGIFDPVTATPFRPANRAYPQDLPNHRPVAYRSIDSKVS